jgi:DNA-binding protein YbaB
VERPQWSALQGVIQDLSRSLDNIEETRQQILEVTGTAWSDDRLLKATVGPRGQLIDLDIDPRVFRNPNSKALSASIIATVRAAVEDVNGKTRKLVEKALPDDRGLGLGVGHDGETAMDRMLSSHDSELPTILKKEDGHGYVS